MNSKEQPLRRGRKSKDEALVLRDQYWVLFLRSKLPEESYASLERLLCPHLQINRREDLMGYSQPFALSKVAQGKRGLSSSVGELPSVVLHAEALAPGATEAFTSILWTALMPHLRPTHIGNQSGSIAIEVKHRLSPRHYALQPAVNAGLGLLNEHGIRRLSRLKHRDALGLLLCHCSVHRKPSKISLTAEAYVFSLLQKCCDEDPALMAIKGSLNQLIRERLRIRDSTSFCKTDRIFLAPRVSAFSVGLRSLLGP